MVEESGRGGENLMTVLLKSGNGILDKRLENNKSSWKTMKYCVIPAKNWRKVKYVSALV